MFAVPEDETPKDDEFPLEPRILEGGRPEPYPKIEIAQKRFVGAPGV